MFKNLSVALESFNHSGELHTFLHCASFRKRKIGEKGPKAIQISEVRIIVGKSVSITIYKFVHEFETWSPLPQALDSHAQVHHRRAAGRERDEAEPESANCHQGGRAQGGICG